MNFAKVPVQVRILEELLAYLIDFAIFFKDLFIFIAKSDKQRAGDTERKTFHPTQVTAMAGAVLIQSQDPGSSSGYPTRVQGPRALGHPGLLFQLTSRELNGKWSCWD